MDGGQWIVDGGRRTVDNGERTMDSGHQPLTLALRRCPSVGRQLTVAAPESV